MNFLSFKFSFLKTNSVVLISVELKFESFVIITEFNKTIKH